MPDHKQNADNFYRTAILSHFTDHEEKLGKVATANAQAAVKFEKDPQTDLSRVTMRMPDGNSEYWQQIALYAEPAKSAFKGAGFIRCNEDGTLYRDVANKKPQVMEILPGNTGTAPDKKAALDIVQGHDMTNYYDQVDKFTGKLAATVQNLTKGGPQPNITVGLHSMGIYGLGAAAKMREGLALQPNDPDVQTVAIEPFGAGQALRQLAARGTEKVYGNHKPEHETQVAQGMTQNISMMRSGIPTIFTIPGGNKENDNREFGQVYIYKPDAKELPPPTKANNGPNDLINSTRPHEAWFMVNSFLRQPDCLRPAIAQDIPQLKAFDAAEIVNGGRDLTGQEKTDSFNRANNILNLAGLANGFHFHATPAPKDIDAQLETLPPAKAFPLLPEEKAQAVSPAIKVSMNTPVMAVAFS